MDFLPSNFHAYFDNFFVIFLIDFCLLLPSGWTSYHLLIKGLSLFLDMVKRLVPSYLQESLLTRFHSAFFQSFNSIFRSTAVLKANRAASRVKLCSKWSVYQIFPSKCLGWSCHLHDITISLSRHSLYAAQYESTVLHTRPPKIRKTIYRSLSKIQMCTNQMEFASAGLEKTADFRLVSANNERNIFKPLLFTFSVIVASWTAAEYYRVHRYVLHRNWRRYKSQFTKTLHQSNANRAHEIVIRRLNSDNQGFFALLQEGVSARLENLTLYETVIYSLVGINTAIFLLWRLPILSTRFMLKNFTHTCNSGLCRTLLTSAFSHAGSFHFIFNTLAFYSFSQAAVPELGREYFLAAVVSSAVFSNFCDHLFSTFRKRPCPSLGASGYVYSIFTFVSLTYPNHHGLLFFLVPVPLLTLLKYLIVFDSVGLTGAWTRIFNIQLGHAAHLGGAAAGAAIWWLAQPHNRKKLRNSMPPELVELYYKTYDFIILNK
ncbi:presenilins-associated rhomboid-like protein, mitochondrial [Schistocerca gregaria]|uniref:presenilins-associated rhomboid-like protein, mitochondrial n=1 Tax=Schistocerca gregaria TaxID=7010 RepID=UPI00211E1C07|nr:presenilins-associated rhomboid-like protein, mitochondrial [Schistocerca gregaria]